MKKYFTIFWIFLFQSIHGQTPLVQWAKCFGGSSNDRAYSAIQTSDGGYIVCGFTNSSDGDVTFNHGNSDGWIVKTDANGAIVWQKSYGGGNADIFRSIAVSSTGYTVCGETSSEDGDVTFNHGMKDFWVVEIGETGNLIWQKTYGGSNDDVAFDLAKSDSGYFVIGQTFSNDGDVTSYNDNGDSWLISINKSGDLLDQKAKGGKEEDAFTSIIASSSGGFLVGGYSLSNDGILEGLNHGGSDAWLVKISKTASLQWMQCYGDSSNDGITEVTQEYSGNYVASGWLTIETNQNSWIFTTDPSGVLISGNNYGGDDKEFGGPLFQISLSRHVSVPSSSSSVSGDLTCHIGGDDIWMNEIENDGSLQWQLCLGGTLDDRSSAGFVNTAGDYILAGYTNSNDEYVSGNHGSYDWWLVKLAPVCATDAIFEYTTDSNVVSFDNDSENGTDWLWDFGDGITSTEKHPIHEFSAPGVYEVCLVSSADSCFSDTFCTDIFICGAPSVAAFNYTIDGGNVAFTNASSNANGWYWTFGDGASSTDENTSHTYTENGVYTVCLTAIDSGCSEDLLCQALTICVNETSSAFEYTIDGGEVNFLNTSPSFTTLQWNFGDGASSTEQNPVHSYAESGTYEACLIVTDPCGTDTSCQTFSICVSPTAGYSYFNTNDFTFNFIDESEKTDEWKWLFGDGTTSADPNPVHTYIYGGTYNVCLVATNSCGNDTTCEEITIECPAFAPGFSFTQSSATVSFFDQSSATADSWNWNFDDGTTSALQNPVHIFAANGTYHVCLKVSDGCTLDSVCHIVTVVGVYADEPGKGTSLNIYPNPMNDFAVIKFTLPEASHISIVLLNMEGRKISAIADQQFSSGLHTIDFERKNLAAGVYLLEVKNKDGFVIRKLVME